MPIHVKLREEFSAPPERVFAALTNLDDASVWMPNLVRIERLTAGDYGPGTRWREVRKMFGREAAEEFEVTRCEPPRTLELHVDGTKGSSRKGYFRFRYDLEPSGAGTAVNLAGEIGGMGRIGEIVGRLFVGTFKKALAKDFSAMKRHLERGSSAG